MFLVRLLITILSLLVSSLTLAKAPGLWGWKLAVLAGEYGQFLCILPLITAAWAFFGSPQRGAWTWVTVALCLLSVILFLKPSLQAASLGRQLADRGEEAFGGAWQDEAFSWSKLWKLSGEAVPVETKSYRTFDDGTELLLDFYRPEEASPAPCVIMIHGGGWDSGDRTEISTLNHWLARRGFAVAAIEYRLAPDWKWPAPAEDVSAAMDYLQQNAGSLGIAGDRFVLFGRSAGGQIATATATRRDDKRVRGAVSFYGPQDMVFAWEYSTEDDVLDSFALLRGYLGGSPDEFPQRYEDASPYLKTDATVKAVPTLLVHGKLDTLVWVEQSKRYASRLDSAGAKSLYLELPWATHGFEFNQNGPGGQLALYALERFLRSQLEAD